MKKIVFGGFWMIAGILMTFAMQDAPLIYSGGFFGFLIDILVLIGYAMLIFGCYISIKGLLEKE